MKLYTDLLADYIQDPDICDIMLMIYDDLDLQCYESCPYGECEGCCVLGPVEVMVK